MGLTWKVSTKPLDDTQVELKVGRYCQILCMVYVLSASVFPFLRCVFEHPVGELHPIDDLGHQLMPVKSSPVFLARTRIRAWVASLNTMVNVASRDPHPLVWRVRCGRQPSRREWLAELLPPRSELAPRKCQPNL